MRYDKSWTPEELPAEARTTGPLGGPDDLFSIAFSGSQALVAGGRHLLVNGGAGWTLDAGAQALLDRYDARVYAVAGLPDGGAVAAGSGGFVIERDTPSGPWHVADQPLPNQPVAAVAAFRENGTVRALASVVFGDTSFPLPDPTQLPPADPGEPAPALPAFAVPSSGTLLRQTATGWRDEDRSGLRSPTADKARVSDPVLAFLIDGAGRGWIAGGWTGVAPTLTDSGATTGGGDVSATAAMARYATAGPERAPGQTATPVPTAAGPARLLVGGHAQCDRACAGMGQLQLMPERTLAQAVAQATAMASQPNGPRALLYTGGRVAPGSGGAAEPQAEADRLAALLGVGNGGAGMPVLAAVSPGDATGGTTAPFQRAFAGAPAPFGVGAAGGGLARTHYAAEVTTSGGRSELLSSTTRRARSPPPTPCRTRPRRNCRGCAPRWPTPRPPASPRSSWAAAASTPATAPRRQPTPPRSPQRCAMAAHRPTSTTAPSARASRPSRPARATASRRSAPARSAIAPARHGPASTCPDSCCWRSTRPSATPPPTARRSPSG